MPAPADPQPAPRIELRGLVVLAENRSAIRALTAIARSVLAGKRVSVCPVVLHGPPGCGKTRLLAAFLAALSEGSSPVTARSEAAGDLARLAASGEDPGFADRDLRTCDVLVLEDIQHLPERASDAVCDLIDRRKSRRRPLVVSANCGPSGLDRLPRRLTSRLSSGLVVQLDPPGPVGRRKILANAAGAKKLRLTPDALDFLAVQPGGLRAALGSLQNLAFIAPQFPGPLDREAVERVLVETGQPTSREADVDAIIGRVASAFGVSEKELRSASRLRSVLVPRQVAMYLARELVGLSLPRIGAAFDRDHTTVLHACRKIEAELETDGVLAARVRQLRAELG